LLTCFSYTYPSTPPGLKYGPASPVRSPRVSRPRLIQASCQAHIP
jgi:hypothetical protein